MTEDIFASTDKLIHKLQDCERTTAMTLKAALERQGYIELCQSDLKGRLAWATDELNFLEAVKKWRSWENMSVSAQGNINKRIERITEKIRRIEEALK